MVAQAIQVCNCLEVCRTWLSSVGYSAWTRTVTKVIVPASTMTAPSSVHQVAASLGIPARCSLPVSGCSNAVSSSAARQGTTTTVHGPRPGR